MFPEFRVDGGMCIGAWFYGLSVFCILVVNCAASNFFVDFYEEQL